MPKNLYNSKVSLFLLKRFFVLVFLFLFYSYPQIIWAAPNSDSMLGYWKFDGNGADSSGDGSTVNALVGTVFSTAVPSTTFPNSNSILFQSLSSYVEMANQPGLHTVDKLSFSMWVRFDQLPQNSTPQIIGGNYSAAESFNGFKFWMDNLNMHFDVGEASVQFPLAGNISAGSTWYHLVGTWDYYTIKIYLNGVEKNSSPYSTTINYANTSLRLGNFLGKMDEVRFYSRVLAAGEISDLATGHHTSATWNGSPGTDYENPNNWNINVVPDPYTIINIPSASEVHFSSDSANYPSEAMAGLNIGSGAILNILDKNLTINDNGVFSNDGILELYNGTNQILSNFVNDINSGAIKISAPADVHGLLTGSTYNDLIINAGNIIRVKVSSDITINGDIKLQEGIFDASPSNYNISLAGNWMNSDMSLGNRFNPRAGTVTLIGTNQTISGKNIFFNLTKSVSNSQTLSFQANSLQTITNNLTLQGNGLTSNFLSLRSTIPSTSGGTGPTVPGEQWNINFDPNKTFASGLDIMDSNRTGGPFVLTGHNKDSGNNTGWTFDTTPPSVTINNIDNNITSDVYGPITGSASDSVAYIKLVEFQLDSEVGTWSSCTANDNSFNSSPEAFTCNPNVAISEGSHTAYVRAKDANGNISSALSTNFTIDTTAPGLTQVNPIVERITTSTPSYTFNSSEVGTISYFGDCSSITSSAVAGDNTITFNSLAEGLHNNCAIKVTDTAGNRSSELQVSAFTVQLPFAISAVSVSNDSSSAIISWSTVDKPTSSIVDYGLSNLYESSTPETDIDSRVTSHAVSISGLASCTTYHYRVRSKDAFLNEVIGVGNSFKTTGCVDTCALNSPDEPDLNEAKSMGTDSIKIYYDDADGDVNHYELKYGLAKDNYEWSVDDIGGKNDEAYTIKLLKPNTTYYFKIRAINDCGKGDWSDEVSETTDKELSNVDSVVTVDSSPSQAEESSVETALLPEAVISAQPAEDVDISSGVPAEDNQGKLENPDNFEKASESSAPSSDKYLVSRVELIKGESSDKIKLSGKGPANEILTVYIYSTPIVLTVKTDSEGNWSYILDNDLEDGKHEVYVTVTGSDGKIIEKSQPIAFMKTAQATTILPASEADAAMRAQSPTQLWYKNSIFSFVLIAVVGLVVAVIVIGFYKHRSNKELEGLNV